MVTIYRIGVGGYWTGESDEIGARDGAPSGWTRTPVPALADGEYALWAAQGWAVTSTAYAPLPLPPPPPDPAAYLEAGAARRTRQFRQALDRNPLAALVQRAKEPQR